jgi:SAM-dependent methyltransferase
MKKTHTRVPPLRVETAVERLERIVCSTSFPFYWLRARAHGIPGLRFASHSGRMGLHALLGKHDDVSYAEVYRMLFTPVESTRYFEFGLAWDFLCDTSARRYLDVSSPRLFPLAFLAEQPGATAELINPNRVDLKLTTGLVRACGLVPRCTLWNALIEEVPFPPSTFDVITSLSVVEHIPADTKAVQRMWDLLKPSGKLVLSVPCAAEAEEQYIDADQFGLQQADEQGFFFLQYVYDEALLRERFYGVLGQPTRYGIYGEREQGSLRRGLIKKWAGEKYPRWREPYTMAKEFQCYQTLRDLPGEGVIVMAFEKK